MKVKVEPMIPARKLVAVIGYEGAGIFLRKSNDKSARYLGPDGLSDPVYSLEELLNITRLDRIAVYEGDVVTIEF